MTFILQMYKSYVFWNQIYDILPPTRGRAFSLNRTSYLVIRLLNTLQWPHCLSDSMEARLFVMGTASLPALSSSLLSQPPGSKYVKLPVIPTHLFFSSLFPGCALPFCLWKQQTEALRSKSLGSTVFSQILALLMISYTIISYTI